MRLAVEMWKGWEIVGLQLQSNVSSLTVQRTRQGRDLGGYAICAVCDAIAITADLRQNDGQSRIV